MFAFVSAFPKSLHCTDEAQQAETVLSAVLSNSIYIYIYIFFLFELLGGRSSQPFDWLPFGEWGKMRTLERGASRVRENIF